MLGKALRKLRLASGLTQGDVVNRTGWSETTIFRHESGQAIPPRRRLATLLDVYRVTGADRDLLMGMASKAKEPGWLDRFEEDQSVTDRYAAFISWETEARKAFVYEALLVPGLLQTDDYARAVIDGTTQSHHPDEVERLVQVRRKRR